MARQNSFNLFDKGFNGLLEDEDEEEKAEYNPNLYSEGFEDEGESWGDINYEVNYNPIVPQHRVLKNDPKPEPVLPPKPSIINQKYFNIKPEEKKIKTQVPKAAEDLTKTVTAKIQDLNEEIKRVKAESEQYKRLKILYDEKMRQYTKEKDDFIKLEQSIKAEIEEFNDTEIEKYKKELKVHERNQKVLASIPNKKERDEIEALKAMQARIKEEGVVKHNRYKINKERVLKLIGEAKVKKNELLQRLETLDLMSPGQSITNNPKGYSGQETGLSHRNSPDDSENFGAGKRINKSFSETFGNVENTAKDYKNYGQETENNIKTNNNTYKAPLDPGTRHYSANKSKSFTDPPKTPEFSDILGLNTPEPSISSKPDPEKMTFLEPEELKTPETSEIIPVVDSKVFPDGRIINYYESGHKETMHPNGTKKEEYPNGYIVTFYTNSDVKQVFPNGKVLYFYAEANTTHTSLPSGLQIIRFGNGQIEKHYPNGSKKIKYIDGTVKTITTEGAEETIYPDNTIEALTASNERIITHPGGHKELISNGIKKRIYTDGSYKILKK
jgi:centromere protein J